MKIATLMLALTLITCCFVGSTFAKYTSESTATDSATVAKWAFTVGSDNIVANNTFTFDLFSTVYDLDAETDKVLTTDDAQIVNDSEGKVLIAPGCGGYVTVTLTNSSEVEATYAVAYTAAEAGVPLKWSATNNGTDWTETPTNISATTIAAGGQATITLYYMWAFEGDNTADTTLGAAGTAAPSITAVVTVTQAD